MTSVTVAGGSFEISRPASKTAGSSEKRDRWLRYGIGVSIAGLLVADAFVLAGMLDDAVPRTRARRTEASAPVVAELVTDGEGFAAFEVPHDLSAAFSTGRVAPAATPAPAATAEAPAAAPALVVPAVAPPPAVVAPTAPVAPFAPAPQATPAPDTGPLPVPVPPASTVIEEVVTVVEQVPVVGPEAAPLVETVTEPVVEVVSTTDVVGAVEPVVEPIVGPVTSVVGGGGIL